MSTLILLDLLAYGGSVLGTLFLFVVSYMLLQRGGTSACLSFLVGQTQAERCMEEGTMKPARARALGGLFLMTAVCMAMCLLRGLGRR